MNHVTQGEFSAKETEVRAPVILRRSVVSLLVLLVAMPEQRARLVKRASGIVAATARHREGNVEEFVEEVSVENLLDRVIAETVVLSKGRCFGKTRGGGSFSLSSANCERQTIRRLRSRDRSKPSVYIGRAPREEYSELQHLILKLVKKDPSART